MRGAAGGGVGAHQSPARLLVGRIEIDDGFRQIAFLLGMAGCVGQSLFQGAQQALAHRVPLGLQPDLEGRIEIVEAGQQVVRETGTFEQQGMHLAGFGGMDHSPHIDIDGAPLETDLLRIDTQAVGARVHEDVAQFADDLAQHGTRLDLPGLAPKQPDQPLARLLQRFAQRNITEDRPQLHALDPDLTAIAPQRYGSE